MRSMLLVWGVAAFFVPAVLAQNTPPAHPSGGPPKPRGLTLNGEDRVKYIARQLDLNEKQQKTFESLLEIYRARLEEEKANIKDTVMRLRVLSQERDQAKAAGNQARVREIEEQIQQLRLGWAAETDLFKSLTPELTDEQKTLLAQARERASRPDGVRMTPADVVHAARKSKLNEEQDKKLEELQRDLRERMNKIPEREEKQRSIVLDQFIKNVRDVLTPEQAQQFDQRLEALRLPKPTAAPLNAPPAPRPASQPAQPAEEKKP